MRLINETLSNIQKAKANLSSIENIFQFTAIIVKANKNNFDLY